MIEVVVNIRKVAYSDGIKDDITSTRQQVDALQKRQDTANIHMDEVTRQNEAMNADLKQMGPVINNAIKAQNKNSRILLRALTDGLVIKTDRVTSSVIQEFQKLTGVTIDQFLKNEIIAGINSNVYQAGKDADKATQASQQAQNVLKKFTSLIQTALSLMTVLVVEFAVIVVAAVVVPGWWKLLGLLITTGGAVLINYHLKGEVENGV